MNTGDAVVVVPTCVNNSSPPPRLSSKDTTGDGPITQDTRVVIIGAGCFGLSTAYHLLNRGYTCITILDRSTILPAPDASSNDINRIVRSSYSDKFYAGLARSAINAWRDRKFWGDTYHESGVLVLGHDNSADERPEAPEAEERADGVQVIPDTRTPPSYADQSYLNDLELGCSLVSLPDPGSIRSAFPSGVPAGSFEGNGSCSSRRVGYLNCDGGWADAGQGVSILLSEVKRLGAKVHPGKSVFAVQHSDGKVTSVLCADGTVYETELAVIATGSWSPSTFPDLGLHETCLATGQCVAMIQLTEQEAAQYKDCPVVLDFTSGFYAFPPTAKNVFKVAVHGPGFLHTENNNISTPRTIISDPATGSAIPKHALLDLRRALREVYPDLAKKPFSSTRLCWYNDSPDGDWIISKHSAIQNVILATAGSGHAYKFLPVIGRLVADLIEDNLEPTLVKKFAMSRARGQLDASRFGAPAELDLSQLCSPVDLDAPSQD